MVRGVILSRHDRLVLQRLLEREKNRGQTTRNRARVENSFVDNVDHQAPESYIAYAPVGGIPGLNLEGTTGTGLLSGPAGDVPGSALCDIYKIVNGVLRSAGFQKRVYNLQSSDVAGTWVFISREKFGRWIVQTGGVSTIPVRISEGVVGTGTLGTGTVFGDPVAVYRTSHPLGFSVIAVDENLDDVGGEFICYADELINVHYSGSIVRIQKNGAKFQIVTTGENNWEDAFTAAGIDVDTSVGTAPETQGPVQMFSNGPTVYAGTSFPIAIHTFCQLRFDNQAQKFRIGDQGCDSNGGAVGT